MFAANIYKVRRAREVVLTRSALVVYRFPSLCTVNPVYYRSVGGTPGASPALAALVINVEKVPLATSAANTVLCRRTRRRRGPFRDAALALGTLSSAGSQTREVPFRTANAQSIIEPAARSGGAFARSAHAARYALFRGATGGVETRRARLCGSRVVLYNEKTADLITSPSGETRGNSWGDFPFVLSPPILHCYCETACNHAQNY